MKKTEIIIIAVIVFVLAIFTGYSVNTIGATSRVEPKKESVKTCYRDLVRNISSNQDLINIPDGWEPFAIGNELWFKRTVCN